LYDLGKNQQKYWEKYIVRLRDAGHERKLDA
jgi:hypothetical protein